MSDRLLHRSSRSATAKFRALAVTTAQQFALLSQPSSPADPAASASPHSRPPPTTRFQLETQQSGKPTSSHHDDTRTHRSAQPEPPSTEPAAGHGLSLQQLRNLVALTAINDGPRDTSRRGCSRRRLSLDSAQRRLDSWNRASKLVFEYSREDTRGVRAERQLKRSKSEPMIARLNGNNSSDSRRPAQPLDAINSEARSQAFRHLPLRRSRSAHAVGREKDTVMAWDDVMTALVWRRGGVVTYRRPESPAPSSLLATDSANSCYRHARYSRQQISPTAISGAPVRAGAPVLSATAANASVTSRLPSPLYQTPLSTSVAASQPSASSQRPWSSPSENARVATQGVTSYYNQFRVRTARHPAGYHAGSARTSVVPMCNEHGHSKLQLQRALRDPVRSVFTWAAEQRIASRRALSAQQ
ncbi:unnamed protein product [Closterium sp. NIES-54]